MKWILIYWIVAGTAVTTSTAEFSSKEKCMAAADALFTSQRYARYQNTMLGSNPPMIGNFICAEQ